MLTARIVSGCYAMITLWYTCTVVFTNGETVMIANAVQFNIDDDAAVMRHHCFRKGCKSMIPKWSWQWMEAHFGCLQIKVQHHYNSTAIVVPYTCICGDSVD